ncbi:hypothetical protein MAE02_11500 [Microvirga aerophila]|uniref:Uncharacterized protein n=1 Tax=Microvirga aerophila TaxID=670291 RepID=A0A512BNC3_9HYPH|nr:hypothetical protein MAE02_11500 [Microvirga aerophila]
MDMGLTYLKPSGRPALEGNEAGLPWAAHDQARGEWPEVHAPLKTERDPPYYRTPLLLITLWDAGLRGDMKPGIQLCPKGFKHPSAELRPRE